MFEGEKTSAGDSALATELVTAETEDGEERTRQQTR